MSSRNHMKHGDAPSGQVLGYRKADGRWQKKINGVLYTFGSREDARNPDLTREDRYARAYTEYTDKLRELNGEGNVRVHEVETLTVREIINRYLEWMLSRTQIKSLKRSTYLDVKGVLTEFAKIVSPGRLVATLGPDDFMRCRVRWNRLDPYSLSRHVAWVRSLFIWAEEEDHVEHRPKFGKMFKRAAIKELRNSMASHAAMHGDKAFTPEEVQAVLPELGWELKAPFLLGLNCAYYAQDVACVTTSHFDLDNRTLWMPRGKNQNFRVNHLWDITVDAIRDFMDRRWVTSPYARKHGLKLGKDDPIFVTKYRRPFVNWNIEENEAGEPTSQSQSNNGTKELNKVLHRLGIKREGVSFGCLRHTFITIADEMGKETETALVAGHKRAGVIEFYVRKYSRQALIDLSNNRIKPVTEFVRGRLGI